jgi:hypothetical protein
MRQKITALSIAATVLAATGCTGLSYKPAERIPAPKAAGAPLPLVLGVASNPKFGEGHPVDVKGAPVAVDPVKALTEALRASGLFREVRVPLAGDQGVPTGSDLTVSSDYDLKSELGSGRGGGIALCVLMIPCPFVTFTDTYTGEATYAVRDAEGRTIKQYTEKTTVEPTYQVFSELTADRTSFPMVVSDLAAKFVADLNQDRALYQRVAPAASEPSTASPVPAGQAAAPQTWWK